MEAAVRAGAPSSACEVPSSGDPAPGTLESARARGADDVDACAETSETLSSSAPQTTASPGDARRAPSAAEGASTSVSPLVASASRPPRLVLQEIVQRKKDEADAYHQLVQARMGPAVYAAFLELMSNFRAQRVDRDRLVDRVMHLFGTDRDVCLGFNRFLGPGYVIEWSEQSGGVMGPALSPSACGRKPRPPPAALAAPTEAPASPHDATRTGRAGSARFGGVGTGGVVATVAAEDGEGEGEGGPAEEVAARTAARDALRTALAMRPRSTTGLQMALELADGAGLDEQIEENLRRARCTRQPRDLPPSPTISHHVALLACLSPAGP